MDKYQAENKQQIGFGWLGLVGLYNMRNYRLTNHCSLSILIRTRPTVHNSATLLLSTEH